MPLDRKRQFNVTLDDELIKAVKQATVDHDQTLSEFVAEALVAHLAERAGRPRRDPSLVVPVPMVTTRNMRGWMALGRALGMSLGMRSRDGRWAELETSGGVLALHAAADDFPPNVELTFDTETELEELVERLRAAGFEVAEPEDWGWGRSITVIAEDMRVDINEHDPATHLD